MWCIDLLCKRKKEKKNIRGAMSECRGMSTMVAVISADRGIQLSALIFHLYPLLTLDIYNGVIYMCCL